jgi:hypothetical protein
MLHNLRVAKFEGQPSPANPDGVLVLSMHVKFRSVELGTDHVCRCDACFVVMSRSNGLLVGGFVQPGGLDVLAQPEDVVGIYC